MPAFQVAGDLVVTDQATLDEAQASGRWVRLEQGGAEGSA